MIDLAGFDFQKVCFRNLISKKADVLNNGFAAAKKPPIRWLSSEDLKS
jgi:hypothetical protein